MRGPRVALFTVCPLNRYARAHAPGNHTASGAPNSAATLIAAGVAALGRCAKGSLRESFLRERRAPATCGYECDRIPRSRPTRIGILRDFERSSGKKPPWISSALGRIARAGSKGVPPVKCDRLSPYGVDHGSSGIRLIAFLRVRKCFFERTSRNDRRAKPADGRATRSICFAPC